MRLCKGRCKEIKPFFHFSENRHGNLMGKCKECVRIERKEYRLWVLSPRRREEQAKLEQQNKRDYEALIKHRPCSIFQGFLFSGDVA